MINHVKNCQALSNVTTWNMRQERDENNVLTCTPLPQSGTTFVRGTLYGDDVPPSERQVGNVFVYVFRSADNKMNDEIRLDECRTLLYERVGDTDDYFIAAERTGTAAATLWKYGEAPFTIIGIGCFDRGAWDNYILQNYRSGMMQYPYFDYTTMPLE